MRKTIRFLAWGLFAAAMSAGTAAFAADVKVMISGGMTAPYKQLVSEFERRTGHTVTTAYGPSMGTAETAIPARLARGEPADVLILADEALDMLVTQGRAVAASRVDLVRSLIAMAVKAGAPKPDIGTTDALRATLLGAKSIAYSQSASGVYIERELFKRLGIEEQMKGKGRAAHGEPAGAMVARGDVDLAFQQVSELLPVAGCDIVGPIPAEVQKVTIFSAALSATATAPDAGRALIDFLAAPASAPVLVKAGLEPIATTAK